MSLLLLFAPANQPSTSPRLADGRGGSSGLGSLSLERGTDFVVRVRAEDSDGDSSGASGAGGMTEHGGTGRASGVESNSDATGMAD